MVVMKFVVILIILLAKGVINEYVDGVREIAEVDALLKAVTQVRWGEDEKPCLEAMIAMLDGVRNSTLWATWMWDANQRPTGTLYGLRYQLGNFDQCLNPPWLKKYPELRPQYCLLDLQLSQGNLHKSRGSFEPYDTATTYINTKSERGRHMNTVSWGLCLPSQCSMKSVFTLGKQMARTSHLITMTDDPSITVNYCHLAGETRSYGFGACVFFTVMLCLLLITITFTYYGQHTFIRTSNTFGANVVKSFCFKSNYAQLFEAKANEITAMNGIRFLTSFSVVWDHVYLFSIGNATINALELDKDIASTLGIFIYHSDLIVDTFFTFSALLYAKSLLSAKPDKPQNLAMSICKRYVRMFGALAVALAFMTFVSGSIDNGPLWQNFAVGEQSKCTNTWWRCLLMLTTSAKEMCYIVTWYIPCDFQLMITGTIIFYIYRNNKINGLHVYGIVSLLSILIPGFLTYWYRLKPVITSSIQDFIVLRSIEGLDYTYFKTYSRAGPYMVGIAMGYLLNIYKPEEHKKVISKIWSFLGTFIALSIMLLMLSLGTIFYDREYSALEVAASVALDRVVWAVAICSIVAFCVYGDLALINDFLSWSFFRPLGRLSYGIYLLHTLFLQRYLFAVRAPFRYDHVTFVIIAAGIASVACVASLFVWLVVEAPLVNISNYLLNNKYPPKIGENTKEVIESRQKKRI